MRTHLTFSHSEERLIARSVREGSPRCPRCGVAVDVWPVPPRSDVSYVRDRIRVVCPSCGRTGVIERRELD